MAYKVFSNGDALTGGELNTYLMNQAVISFASTTARDAALPSPSEGQLVWLEDANKYVYYTGSAWADLITPASSGNAIINGAFDIWQRGTSFTDPNNTYTTDRWRFLFNGTGSRTVSRQTFTPGTAPVAGYEGAYYCSVNQTTAGSSGTYQVFDTTIEDVRTLAGQTFTVSFWAKANATQSVTASMNQNFGSGGSTEVAAIGSTTFNLTTSWARYTFTGTMTSIAGKTIGTGSYAFLRLSLPLNATFTIDLWGFQLESGSTATAFKRNASNIQGELAACQRYYYRRSGSASSQNPLAVGFSLSSQDFEAYIQHPVPMRTIPTFGYSATADVTVTGVAGTYTSTLLNPDLSSAEGMLFRIRISGSVSTGIPGYYRVENASTKYVDWSAEL